MARRRKRSQLSPGSNSVDEPGVRTYQTRISGYSDVAREAGDVALAAYAEVYGRVQRKLFAEVAAGSAATSAKNAYVDSHGIPSRMFNAIRVSLQGKISSVRETMLLRLLLRLDSLAIS